MEAPPERLRRGDDKSVELVPGVRGRLHRRVPGGQEHREGGSLPACSGLRVGRPPERLTGGPNGIDRVALGAVATPGPPRPVDLDHLLAPVLEEAGEARSVAARALDGPGPAQPVGIRPIDQRLVTDAFGAHRALGQRRAGPGGNRRRGVGVFVGVDADDDVDLLCQHGHAFISLHRRDVSVPVREEDGRTVTGHAERLGGQAPDQASNSDQAGAGDHGQTGPLQGTTPVRIWVMPAVTASSPARSPDCEADTHSSRCGRPTAQLCGSGTTFGRSNARKWCQNG